MIIDGRTPSGLARIPDTRRVTLECRGARGDPLAELGLERGLHLDVHPLAGLLLAAGLLLDVLAPHTLARVRAGDLGLVALAVVLQTSGALAVAPLVVSPLPVGSQTSNLEVGISVMSRISPGFR